MTKIGLVVDGRSEYYCLPGLCRDIFQQGEQEYVGPPALLKCSPDAPLKTLLEECAVSLRLFARKGVARVIVLIDHERSTECPGARAKQLEGRLQRLSQIEIKVVIKVRTFENWLLADPDALRLSPKRFQVSAAVERRISPNLADGIDDAETVLNTCVIGRRYEKVADSQAIISKADPTRIAANSRSFRCFVRQLGHPLYREQSRRPAR